MAMISIGQMIGRATGALWRRRWAVLALTIAWLALDGLLLGYLKVFHPTLGLASANWLSGVAVEIGMAVDAIQFLVLLLHEILSDAVRAVFAVLVLRVLLMPVPGAGVRQEFGLFGPILLILLFELAWTALLFPLDHGLLQIVARNASGSVPDATTLGVVSGVAQALIFGCYSLAMAKLCFVYPIATLRRGLRPLRSWRQTKGFALRLFLIFLAIPVPFYMLRMVLMPVIFQYDFMPEAYQVLALALLLADSLQDVPAAVLTLAVIVVGYVAATGFPSGAIPGARRTSAQLAEAFE